MFQENHCFGGALLPKTNLNGIGVVAFYGKGQARTKRSNLQNELFPHQRSDWLTNLSSSE